MGIMARINSAIINPLITVLFVFAVGYFLYGIFVFVKNQDNEEAQAEGRRHMFWAVLGIAIMLSVGGILNVIAGSVRSII